MALTIASALKVCSEWRHVRATAGIALIVGTWLTLVNQADVALASGVDAKLVCKISMNYLTPFAVSNLGLLARKR